MSVRADKCAPVSVGGSARDPARPLPCPYCRDLCVVLLRGRADVCPVCAALAEAAFQDWRRAL